MPAINAALPGVPIIAAWQRGERSRRQPHAGSTGACSPRARVGVAIGGDVRVDCLVSQGCRPIGQPWVVTKAQNNVIHEIGRRPVSRWIQTTAAELEPEEQNCCAAGFSSAAVINEYREEFDRGDFLIRNIIGADQTAGYIAIADLVRVGQTIQFHVRDAASAEEDLQLKLNEAREAGSAAGLLVCTCNGRGSRMFGKPGTESRMIQKTLGDLPMAGFFAAGGSARRRREFHPRLHGEHGAVPLSFRFQGFRFQDAVAFKLEP